MVCKDRPRLEYGESCSIDDDIIQDTESRSSKTTRNTKTPTNWGWSSDKSEQFLTTSKPIEEQVAVQNYQEGFDDVEDGKLNVVENFKAALLYFSTPSDSSTISSVSKHVN